jgi:hypothetical protein
MRPVPHLMGTNTAPSTIDGESLELLAVVGGILHGLGRWSDGYVNQAFHFEKMSKAAGAEHPGTLQSMKPGRNTETPGQV